MKSTCAFQKWKICGFPDKCPSKSINFVNLNFKIKICLPLDIITQFLCSSWFTNSPWTQTLYRHEDIALHTWWIIKILLKNKFCNDFTSFLADTKCFFVFVYFNIHVCKQCWKSYSIVCTLRILVLKMVMMCEIPVTFSNYFTCSLQSQQSTRIL